MVIFNRNFFNVELKYVSFCSHLLSRGLVWFQQCPREVNTVDRLLNKGCSAVLGLVGIFIPFFFFLLMTLTLPVLNARME